MTQWILTSSLLIVVVLLIRKLAGDKLSARVRYALWGVVLLRLLIPVSIGESALSVQNWMPKEKEYTQVQTEPVLIKDIMETIESSETAQSTGVTISESENAKTTVLWPVVIWVAGMVIVAAVFLLSNLLFWLSLRRSRIFVTKQTLPVYVTASIDSPCMYGLFRPAVYVTPVVLAENTAQQYVLAHELTHYRHGDHVWAFLRCLAVVLHWYNPLVWTASFASQQDGELACDEGALRVIGEENRKEYARTLIDLTCVGYGGMLTTATSMTGRKCDLRNRVVRISKNPKMTVTALSAVLLSAAIVAVMLFTGAAAPAIEGVWRIETILWENESPEGDMVHEFYKGLGRRTDYVDGEVYSARKFRYTIEENVLTIDYGEPYDVITCVWGVKDGKLIMGDGYGSISVPWEQKSVPYLPDGYCELSTLTMSRPDESLSCELTDSQEAQLLDMLRQGEILETRKETLSNLDYMCRAYILNGEFYGVLHVANGLVYGKNTEKGYVLSNIEEIEDWLETLIWEPENGKTVQLNDFVPADLQGIVSARLVLNDRAYLADPTQLAFLEELLTTAVPLYPTQCPYNGLLEVSLADGRVLGIAPALDGCAAFRIGNAYYEYGNQFAYDDEGSYDNTELLAVFGVEYADVEALWAATREEHIFGSYRDYQIIGDYTEVHSFEECHAMLSENAQKNVDGERVIHCQTSTQTGYYVEEFLGSEAVGYETKSCSHNMVGGYDKRYQYLDEYWAHCTFCNSTKQFHEIRYGEWVCKLK